MSRKILFFTQSLAYGGDDTVLIELIGAWPGADDELAVAINRSHPGRRRYEEQARRAVLHVVNEDTIEEEKRRAGLGALVRPWRFVGTVARLAGFLRARRPDALFVSSGGFPPTALAWRMLAAAKAARVPYVCLIVHNYPPPPAGFLRDALRGLFGRLSLLACDDAVSVSRACAQVLEAFNLGPRPIRVIHNGFAPRSGNDPARQRLELGVEAGAPLIGAIGNLEERKGFDVLIRAMKEVCAEFPDCRLVIIGAASQPGAREGLERLIGESGLAGKVRLAGYLSDACRYAECFDVCAVSSVSHESLPLAALEAMQCGKPVVATRLGGLPEIVVEGETGLVVPPGDAEALARALLSLLRSPETARRMGEAGRRRWQESFQASAMARQYRALLG